VGVEPNSSSVPLCPSTKGRFINDQDLASAAASAVLGSKSAQLLFPGRPTLGETSPSTMSLHRGGPRAAHQPRQQRLRQSKVYIPLSFMQELFDMKRQRRPRMRCPHQLSRG